MSLAQKICGSALTLAVSLCPAWAEDFAPQSRLKPCVSPPFHDCFGTRVGEDGTSYTGEWQDDQYNGQGLLVEGASRYVGGFKNGLFHGSGKFFPSNGDTYDGTWEDCEKDGLGIYAFVSGSRYEGAW